MVLFNVSTLIHLSDVFFLFLWFFFPRFCSHPSCSLALHSCPRRTPETCGFHAHSCQNFISSPHISLTPRPLTPNRICPFQCPWVTLNWKRTKQNSLPWWSIQTYHRPCLSSYPINFPAQPGLCHLHLVNVCLFPFPLPLALAQLQVHVAKFIAALQIDKQVQDGHLAPRQIHFPQCPWGGAH